MIANEKHNSEGEPWVINDCGVLQTRDKEWLLDQGYTGFQFHISTGYYPIDMWSTCRKAWGMEEKLEKKGWCFGFGIGGKTWGTNCGCWIRKGGSCFGEPYSTQEEARRAAIAYVIKTLKEDSDVPKKIVNKIISQTTQTTLF
jgi:hypothetical protein